MAGPCPGYGTAQPILVQVSRVTAEQQPAIMHAGSSMAEQQPAMHGVLARCLAPLLQFLFL
ncbi:sec.4-like phosphatidylinositol transfer protein [Corchorus olitorius]|uniref:Sec.4-like phosphatidylinositol transfer protein n=1 Tax=Corchorus olitorius TaxID=93759 RepID=A0A1R3GG97_9ROSI|nr:sec.4-like phosphatidylinositol transfer protein [Corchorus olitorius]